MAGTRTAKRKVEDVPKAVKAKKAKATKKEPEATAEQVDGVAEPIADAVDTVVPEKESSGPTLFVEASKECQCFNKRFEHLSTALKAIDKEVTLKLNPEKPRKGAFVVRRASDNHILLSLLDMPRPFTKLKALDSAPGWEAVAKDVLEKLNLPVA